jgi:hypothetical protein
MGTNEQITTIIAVVTAMVTTFGGLVTLTWWLSRQFSQNRQVVYKAVGQLQSVLMARMDKHDDKDDSRFEEVNRRVWGIEVRNAARDGTASPEFERKYESPQHRR